MKKEKKVKKKKNVLNRLLLCVLLVGVILLGYFVYTNFFKKNNVVSAPKVVDEIKSFEYTVNENDTKLFKSTFNELKKVLSTKEVDKKAYAEAVSKLFVIDFFSLSNKTSKNDVGGVQFVFSSYKSDFIDYARDGIYKQVNNAIDGNKNDSLPTVTKVNISKSEEVSPSSIFPNIDFGEGSVGYEVSIDWEYENGDGFQHNAKLIVATDKEKLSIVKMTEE
ncbi:MAG: hypothetical protein IJH20_00210 [Bacilli bacterium]|nr:hypothetical protein [Bacilli bacterium]